MTPDERQRSESERFNELLGRSRFDDSVCEQHQHDLRARVLRAFDCRQQDAQAGRPDAARHWHAKQAVGIIAAVAAVVLCIVWVRFTRDRDMPSGSVARFEYESDATADSLFVESLVAIDALGEGVPPRLLFDALAMCQQEHEAAEFDFEATRMQLLHELSFPEPPSESPKG